MAKAIIEPGTARLQVRQADHPATLPSCQPLNAQAVMSGICLDALRNIPVKADVSHLNNIVMCFI